MSSPGVIALAAVAVLAASSPGQAQSQQPPTHAAPPSGLGRAPTPSELRSWDLAVSPDGDELPPGSGTATQGAIVYTQRGCATCHGPTGSEGPALPLVNAMPTMGTNYFPIAYWPFAPTIWDYMYRAMPYDRPGNLTVDETYALTALLLFRNGIVKEADVIDDETLPKVKMPHRADYKPPTAWTPDKPRGFRIRP